MTLKELKKLFPDGTALDKYGWIIHIDSVYIRLIPVTLCPDGTARRENGTTIAREDMAHIEMETLFERTYKRIMSLLGNAPAPSRPSSLSFMTFGH